MSVLGSKSSTTVTVASCSSSEYSAACPRPLPPALDGDAMPLHSSSDSIAVLSCAHAPRMSYRGKDAEAGYRLDDALCTKPPYASSTFAAFWAACSASMRRCCIAYMEHSIMRFRGADSTYLSSCLSKILLLPRLGLLLALFLFGQLAFVKACQEFPGVECRFWVERGG